MLQNRSACRWGDVADGIGGANCRHSYAAYFPGMKSAYKPNPRHPSGVSNEKAYGLTQRQRALERRIREAKRELRGAQMLYEADPKPESLAGVADAKARLRKRQAAMRKLVAENPRVLQRSPRREWAGDMPKGTRSNMMKTNGSYTAIAIDEFSPCLRRCSDGTVVKTAVKDISRKELKNYTEKNGWYIDWANVPEGTIVKKLTVEGSDEAEGLVGFQEDRANAAVRCHWAVAAPHNQGIKGSKRYDGVGGHLFAIMAQASMELGYNGFVWGTAANKSLLAHYVQKLGAVPIGNLNFAIDENAAKILLERYSWSNP